MANKSLKKKKVSLSLSLFLYYFSFPLSFLPLSNENPNSSESLFPFYGIPLPQYPTPLVVNLPWSKERIKKNREIIFE